MYHLSPPFNSMSSRVGFGRKRNHELDPHDLVLLLSSCCDENKKTAYDRPTSKSSNPPEILAVEQLFALKRLKREKKPVQDTWGTFQIDSVSPVLRGFDQSPFIARIQAYMPPVLTWRLRRLRGFS
jgi:hypothetical protein